MDLARLLAGGLAVNRIAFGANYLARPGSAGPTWIGRAARRPGAQVMIRSQGARDVALGAGALASLLRGRDARAWMAAHAFADAADTFATWLARERLPRGTARMATGIAAGSTLVALVGAAAARPPR